MYNNPEPQCDVDLMPTLQLLFNRANTELRRQSVTRSSLDVASTTSVSEGAAGGQRSPGTGSGLHLYKQYKM